MPCGDWESWIWPRSGRTRSLIGCLSFQQGDRYLSLQLRSRCLGFPGARVLDLSPRLDPLDRLLDPGGDEVRQGHVSQIAAVLLTLGDGVEEHPLQRLAHVRL